MGPRRAVTATTAYLDASAAVKLLRPEPETSALRAALAAIAGHVSSELLEIELRCVAHREGGGELLARPTTSAPPLTYSPTPRPYAPVPAKPSCHLSAPSTHCTSQRRSTCGSKLSSW